MICKLKQGDLGFLSKWYWLQEDKKVQRSIVLLVFDFVVNVWSNPYCSIKYLRCFVRFDTICAILKMWKTPMEECYF